LLKRKKLVDKLQITRYYCLQSQKNTEAVRQHEAPALTNLLLLKYRGSASTQLRN